MIPPYITAWTGELGQVARPEPLLGGHLAIFSREGRRGDGAPMWGHLNEERQRRCALLRLCQVCGELLPTEGIAVVMPVDRLTRTNVLPCRGHEPLICFNCVPAALRCPRVRQAHAAGNLFMIAVSTYNVGMHILEGFEAPEDERELEVNAALAAAEGPVAGFIEIFIRHGEVLDLRALLKFMGISL